MRAKLKEPSTYLRGTATRGLSTDGEVVRDGGDSGAGLIRGFVAVSRGEALGHDMWLDGDFLAETAAAINAAGNRGIKSRFTHPDMSGDGLGTTLGRVKSARVAGDRVLADLHLIESSHSTPDGDLGNFVMDMAEQDPDLFGTSIVFRRDMDAEDAFTTANTNRIGKFTSPDNRNLENLPHSRLAELRAVDAVDEPAANPEGMFTTGSSRIVADADRLLEYALGVSDVEPVLTELVGFSPKRIREWLPKWLDRAGMKIVRTEEQHSEPDADDLDDFAERLRATGDPDIVLGWCGRQHRKESLRAMADIDAMAASVAGHDRELADRKLYG